MNKLIIFDFDGVLRDASWNHLYSAYKKLVEAMGKNPEIFFTNLASFKKWYNIDWHKNEIRILGLDEYVPSPEFNRIFHENYDPLLGIFPWVPDALAHLSKKYTLVIFSSSSRLSVKTALGDLSRFFSLIVGSEDVTRLKPHPEGVFLALNITKTAADETLMIGDMNVDYLAAKNAGVKTGLVKWGMGEWEDLTNLKPDYLFEKPEDLLSF